ncbi:hypothetical protein JCM11491_003282 [Sporobolomyces phaffii]
MLSATPAQKFRAALGSPTASLSLLDRLYFKVQATQPNADPLDALRNTDPSTRQTSLHIAANAGRLDVVEWLLEQGVEKDISRDAAGETVLHCAAAKGFVEILALYLDQFQFVVDWANSKGMTPLHTAAMRGELESAQILIEHGADINAPDLQGSTPLHYALSYGKLSVVKMLVEHDCETDLKNNQGFSASDFAYSFSAADALKVYIRIHQDALKAARASRSRRPRNPRVDSGASSSSRKPSRVGSSSKLSEAIAPVPLPLDELISPPLQPIASPSYSQSAASPSLSDIQPVFPGRHGLGMRLSGSLRKLSTDAEGGRDSPLPAPVPVRPAPTSPSLISLHPATPTSPHSPGYSQYNTTSPARSPVDPSATSSPGRGPTAAEPSRPESQSPLAMRSRSRENSQVSPRFLAADPSSSYFDASTGPSGASTATATPSSSPSDTRPPPIPLNLPRSRSASSSSDFVPTNSSSSNPVPGPKKLRKKGGRRDSLAQEQPRPLSVGSVPLGSTVLGGGPGGKKLRSERSMSFGTAMSSTVDLSAMRPVDSNALGGGFGRSRSSTNQSLASYSSSSGHEMPPPPPVPTLDARVAPASGSRGTDREYADMLPSSPPLGRPLVTPPSPPQHDPSPPPVPFVPPPPPRPTADPATATPPVPTSSLTTTRGLEPSFVVVSGSSTKSPSPHAPSRAVFASSPSAETVPLARLSQASSSAASRHSMIALGRPPAAAGTAPPEVAAKLRKASAGAHRNRSASDVGRSDANANAKTGGRFARALGFGRKAT